MTSPRSRKSDLSDKDGAIAAIAESRKSRSEDDRPHPFVGAVVVKDGEELLAQAFRGEVEPGEHAEFGVLERKLSDVPAAEADDIHDT